MFSTKHRQILMTVTVALLSAIAYVLTLFPKFNIFPIAPWLDIDFADAPALVAAYLYGPIAGFVTVVIKSLIHMFTVSTTGIVGFIANILTGGSLVCVSGLFGIIFKKKMKPLWATLASAAIAIPVQIGAAIFVNLYILLPMYGIDLVEYFGSATPYVAVLSAHNLIKDVLAVALSSFVILPIYNKR